MEKGDVKEKEDWCRIKGLWVLLLSLLVVSYAWTWAWAEEEIKIEEVVVTASRLEEPLKETTSDVISISREEIETRNVEFATDILRQIPELNLVQNGGAGKSATVFLRGGSTTQTLVMIDGVKVKSTTTGSFDFSGLLVDDIERIEIVKGPQSTIYGSEAMAGVINIITKKGKGKPKMDVSLEAGSFGTYKPVLSVYGGTEKLDYRLTASYLKTDGISAAKTGTEKDGYENAAVSGKFGFKVTNNAELEFTGRYSYDWNELDSFKADDLNYVEHGNHHMFSGKGKLYLLNIWEQVLTLSSVRDELRLRDPDTSFNEADITTGIETVDWQHNLYISEPYTLTMGTEYRKEKAERQGTFDETVDNKAVYLNNKLKVFEDTLILNAGLRYDNHETFGDETTYRLGALYNIEPVGLRVRSSYGTGFRAPTLNELFYQDPWGSSGNPDLKPEQSSSWEVGMNKGLFGEKVSLSVTYFEQQYEDLIQWEEVAPWVWQPQNVAEAEVKGVETDVLVKVTDAFNLKAGYTNLDTEDKTTGQRLRRRPKDKLNVQATLSGERFSLLADYIFVGERLDAGNELDSYNLVNLSGSYRLTKNLRLTARVENLMDEDYEEADGFGTPGTAFYGGIKTSF